MKRIPLQMSVHMELDGTWMQRRTASRIGAAGPVCPRQGHKFLSVHQHFSLPPVAYEACRCSRIASRGAPPLPSQCTGGHDGIEPNATTKRITEENLSSTGGEYDGKAARPTDRPASPSPFFYIASSHHPSICGPLH